MGFHDIQFPTDISYGSRGGPSFSTSVVRLDSGTREAVSRWSTPLWKFDASYGVRSLDDLYSVVDFAVARDGPANTFRYKDHLDFNTSSNGRDAVDKEDVEIGVGDGTETQFQLLKKYGVGTAFVRSRPISLPVSGTLVVAVAGVLQTETTDYTVNYTTGVVTFGTAPPASDSVTAGFEFDNMCHFGEEIDDSLQVAITGYEGGAVSAPIPIYEVRNEVQVEDEFFYGGHIDHGAVAADVNMTVTQGRAQMVSPSTSGLAMILPDATSLPTGGPYFYIINDSASNTMTLEAYPGGGTNILTLGTLTTTIVLLSATSGGTKYWHAFS